MVGRLIFTREGLKIGAHVMSGLQTTPLPEESPDVAQRFTKKDVSSSLRNSESGMIDQVMVTTNVDGQRFVKVKVRSEGEVELLVEP
jgi:DNA-directed RNA polymerase II subunit RPB2